MKNTPFSKKSFLLITLLSISLFLGTLSTVTASASTPIVVSQMGCPQVIPPITLYQTDSLGRLIKDTTTPSGFAYNQLDLYLGSWTTHSIGFSIAVAGSNEIDWTLDNSTWALTFLNQDPTLGYALTYDSSGLNNTAVPNHQSLLCSFKTAHAGTQQIRVTSPNGGDNGDSVKYTMTVIIVDNSPAPAASPAPQVMK